MKIHTVCIKYKQRYKVINEKEQENMGRRKHIGIKYLYGLRLSRGEWRYLFLFVLTEIQMYNKRISVLS